MIRVVVVDDHAVVRDGLAQLLAASSDIELAGTAANGEDAVRVTLEQEPDVVLMDLSMPGIDGIEATRRVKERLSRTNVLVLTSYSDKERVLAALDAGATGYLLKDAEPDEIVEAVRAASRGESPLHPRAARAVLSARMGGDPLDELTEREREVLSLLASGMQNKQIARRLEISEKTVKAHLTSVFRRIGVADRMQAALWAQERGLRRNVR
jgi:DNA-binding NarL/FixJ family response regulator